MLSFLIGQFGSFKLVIDKNTGCFNATKLCQYGNKSYSNWFRLEKTKALFQYLKSDPSQVKGLSQERNSFAFVYESNHGDISESGKLVSGTYLRKELILDIASWISPEFYFKCNDIILDYFEREYQRTIRTQEDKIDKLVKMITEMGIDLKTTRCQNDELLEQNEEIFGKLEEIQEDLVETNNKLDKALPDRNVDPKQNQLKHHYILFKNRVIENEYVFVRGQQRHIRNKKNEYQTEYEITIDQTKTPNPIDLVNRLKTEIKSINERVVQDTIRDLKDSEDYHAMNATEKRRAVTKLKKERSVIDYRMNKIRLVSFGEDDLLKLIRKLDDEKYEV